MGVVLASRLEEALCAWTETFEPSDDDEEEGEDDGAEEHATKHEEGWEREEERVLELLWHRIDAFTLSGNRIRETVACLNAGPVDLIPDIIPVIGHIVFAKSQSCFSISNIYLYWNGFLCKIGQCNDRCFFHFVMPKLERR